MHSEIKPLTAVRGIAACYVVLYHSFRTRGTALNHGYLAVDLFFVLSGFVMSLSYERMFIDTVTVRNYVDFILRRLGRIYPLYLLTTISSLTLILFRQLPLTDGRPVRSTLPYNMFMVQAWGFSGSINYPSWSISTEWFAYLLFPFLIVILYRRNPVIMPLATALSGTALVWLAFMPTPVGVEHRSGPLDCAWNYSFLPVLRCLAEFTAGISTYRLSKSAAIREWPGWSIATPILALAIVLLLFIPSTDLAVVFLFPAAVLALSCDAGPVRRVLSTGPLVLLGDLSFAIYLLHPIVLLIGNTEIQAAIHRAADRSNFPLLSLLGHFPVKLEAWPLLLVTAFFVHVWFEKPMRDSIKRLVPKLQGSSYAQRPQSLKI